MKKTAIGICTLIIFLLNTVYAFGADAPISNAPYLESVSFKNAAIDGGFNMEKTSFDLILENSGSTPTVEDYSVSGNANVFVTYNYDKANHQNGMQITLAFENGSVIYKFNYKNVQQYQITNNANLAAISCEYGEIQPEINSQTTSYKLYIPSDLTVLDITPIPEDISAFCAPVSIQLNENQEPVINLTVEASNGETKKYTFKVKRINKTVFEVDEKIKEQNQTSFVHGELFYQKPEFAVTVLSAIGGIIVLIIIALLMKRVVINPYDKDEKEFYLNVDENNSDIQNEK